MSRTLLRSTWVRDELQRLCLPSLAVVSIGTRSFSLGKRRRRKPPPMPEKFRSSQEQPLGDHGGSISKPFQLSEDTMDDYLKKASLSPWVPVPDPVARKMLELAKAGPDDVRLIFALRLAAVLCCFQQTKTFFCFIGPY